MEDQPSVYTFHLGILPITWQTFVNQNSDGVKQEPKKKDEDSLKMLLEVNTTTFNWGLQLNFYRVFHSESNDVYKMCIV